MKTRAEMLAEKNKKKSAAERTVPLDTAPKGEMECPECEETVSLKGLAVRDDGYLECPECAAPLPVKPSSKKPEKPKAKPETEEEEDDEDEDDDEEEDEKPAPKKKVVTKKKDEEEDDEEDEDEDDEDEEEEPPPKKKSSVSNQSDTKPGKIPQAEKHAYCGQCGSEWPILKGEPVKNCGHMEALEVSDPRMAKQIKPPAGLTGVKIPEGPTPSHPAPSQPTMTLSGNRLSVGWPECKFPVVDSYNGMKIPNIIITVEVGPGDDRLVVARKLLEDAKAIADLMFDSSLAWYKRKLGAMDKK